MGFEREDPLGIPYEPTIEERALLALELRRELVGKLKLEYVVRFNGSQRYRSPIPTGEELLRHASIEQCGTFGGYRWFRASVCLPCQVPDGRSHDTDPYRDTVELCLPDGQRWEYVSYEDEAHLAPFDARRPHGGSDQRITAIVFVTAALIIGGIVGESQWGSITAMRKKIRAWCDTVDAMTDPGKTAHSESRDSPTMPKR